ncbi:jerky protein homolog-like [Spodoptera litura]|uniref:Jerky protein homolog-like n=1 Tax=Spodoptera litura TaxID=69820 RepID=A0A9J7E2R7_SPOLT|nr:jerky protein homolog-like [Spodoptera litura]XP_022823360.1 jerky protein homolog-like [Spodoptera litura]
MADKKRKHETLSLVKKMEILRKLDSGENQMKLAGEYGVGRATIYDIKKNREKIENFANTADAGTSSRQTVKIGEYPVMEDALYTWFLQERARHTPLTGDIIRQKALTFYEKIYKNANFKASDGWFQNFKSRYGIRLLTITGEKLSSDTSAVAPFVEKFKKKVDDLGLTPDQVYNADESGLFWRVLPNKTYVYRKESEAPGRKVSKDRVTIMPCANASGTHKLKLLFIGKAKNPRAFKNVNLPLVYKNQNKAWVTKELFVDWFHNDFVPAVRKFLKSKNLPPKAVLLLDNAPAHGPNDELSSRDGKIQTLFMPPNCTPLLQPMDQNVIQMIKCNYKKKLLLNAVIRDDDATKTLKDMNLKDAVFNVTEAWNMVPQKAIQSSWKKLWPSLNQNPEEEEEWESEDELPLAELKQMLFQKNQTELTEQDVEEWFAENSDSFPAMTDEEIINDAVSSSEQDDLEMTLLSPTSPSVKAEDGLKSIDVSIRWAEENNASNDILLNLRKLREMIIKKIYYGKKQVKIDNYLVKASSSSSAAENVTNDEPNM